MQQNKNTPSIRFAGFTDAWEQREVGEWGDFYYGKSAPKWSVSDDAPTPCIRYGELYTKFGCKVDRVYSYTNIPPEKLVFSKGTEVLVPRVGEDPMDYNHCTWLSLKGVAIGEMISVYNTQQNPLFTAIMFNATLQEEFAKRVEGGSVTNLYYDKLKNITVSFPTLAEQSKIAAVFENIDTLITLHQRKYDQLVNIKKSMLEKMFPKNGKTVPEVRFAGFTDVWEQRKLGEITSSYSGGTPSAGNKEFYVGQIPFIRSGEIHSSSTELFINNRALDSSSAKLVKKGDILYALYGATSGEVSRAQLDGAINQAILAIIPTSGQDADFIVEWLRKEKQNITSTYLQGGQGNLSAQIVKELLISIARPEEQQKIGRVFRKINDLITLHQRKLERLQNIKKACLEKMFV